eukprot:11568501-Ditylum_brightwellii.AAC.1
MQHPQQQEEAISKNARRISNPAIQAIIKRISPDKKELKRKSLEHDEHEHINNQQMEVFNSAHF